jgi:phosphoribosylglycinamide formyltransferase-1
MSEEKVGSKKLEVRKLAIFASGAGSNAKKIIEHFSDNPSIKIVFVACNKPEAGVLQIAADHQIPTLIIEKEQFFRGNAYVDELKAAGIDFIILAGFLWKVPAPLLHSFLGRMLNIHPALLPKYGGKGMYGHFVHKAVIANKETESGITIHFVDEEYDHGSVVFQARCDVDENDTPETLAAKIHLLEHEHYPNVIDSVLLMQEN